MRIPQTFIDEVLTRINIVDVINARVPLKKRGANYIACCPFHNEKTPSFSVSAVKQIYHCFGCGVGGNTISFLMEYDKYHFVEAIEYLAGQLGLALPKEVGQIAPTGQQTDKHLSDALLKAAQFYRLQLKNSVEAIHYLKQRGLSGEIAKEFAIGFVPEQWDSLLNAFPDLAKELFSAGMLNKKERGGYYDRFRDRIMFPIRNIRGEVIGFGGRCLGKTDDKTPKYLNSPETPLFNKSKTLYGLYEVLQHNKQPKQLLVAEGYLDVVSLHQHGIKTAVATLGTATTSDHIAQLFRYTNEIVFCFDGDQAGKTAAWRALQSSLPHLREHKKIHFLLIPPGEDPDSIVQKKGVKVFNGYLMAAQPFSEFLFAYCKQNINIKTLEGKAQLASQASESIKKIPPGNLQKMLWQELSTLVGLDVNTLQGSVNDKAIWQDVLPKKINKKVLNKFPPARAAITLLLQYPKLVSHLQHWEEIQQLNVKGIEVLKEIVALLHRNPNLTTGALLNHWQANSVFHAMSQLAAHELPYDEAGFIKEFQDTCLRMYKLYLDQQIDGLFEKANNNELTQDEKITLQSLLKVSQGVDNKN